MENQFAVGHRIAIRERKEANMKTETNTGPTTRREERIEAGGPLPDLEKGRGAVERSEQLKNLLILLELHLQYFRDGLPEAREIYRREVDVYDVGYLTSLLEMLYDEDKFRRWKIFTTHRFGGFKGRQYGRKGNQKRKGG